MSRRRMLLIAFLLALVSAASAVAAIAAQASQSAPSPVTVVQLSPEVWLAIASALIGLGIQLGQLRSVKSGLKELAGKVGALEANIITEKGETAKKFEKLADEYVRRDYWKEQIETIRKGIDRLQDLVDRRR